jgi:hypothetical protein
MEERIRRENEDLRDGYWERISLGSSIWKRAREYLERRKETTKYVDEGKIDVMSQS